MAHCRVNFTFYYLTCILLSIIQKANEENVQIYNFPLFIGLQMWSLLFLICPQHVPLQ
jgi:hypothetical protein